MAHPYQLDTLAFATHTHAQKVASLRDKLSRFAATLALDIEQEERRSGIHDEQDPAYPTIARNLKARERNIRATIARLQETRTPMP
jgi:hypothetical protein